MENVVEKLGFFDFLNLIFVGLYTIVGCFIIAYQFGWDISNNIFTYLVNTTEVNALFLILCIFSLISISYIVGMVCHELFHTIDRLKNDTFHTLIENLFNENSCVDNKIKRNQYAALAVIIFKNTGIKNKKGELITERNTKWDYDLNNYFFTYCLYQVQIRGLHKKTEKLRDIEGLAKSFCVSTFCLLLLFMGVGLLSSNTFFLTALFYWIEAVFLFFIICVFYKHWRKTLNKSNRKVCVFLILVILIVGGAISWDMYSLPALIYGIEAVLLTVISLTFYKYREKALKNRIRMTIALFEAVYESEKTDLKK